MEIQRKGKSNLGKLYANLWSLFLVFASSHPWCLVFNQVLENRKLPTSQALENSSIT